jgi:RNA polymerase sigma factor (TIGR02999 family)
MTKSLDTPDVTQLLVKWREGDSAALGALMPMVYAELRRVARARLRGEDGARSLQTTALVHEAYLRLVDINQLTFENRAHFFAIAARLMRQIVVDHARWKRADKRGGGAGTLTLDDADAAATPNTVDVIALNSALEQLARVEERPSRVVELKFFAGLTIEETALALGVSPATVERDWAVAKAWLYRRLAG